jgi:hypothetical protein
MTRPTPRISDLAGRSPITESPVAPDMMPVEPIDHPTPPKSSRKPSPPQTQSPLVKYSVAYPQDLLDRARSALVFTQTTEGVRSMKDLAIIALANEVKRLERKYNEGNPFPSVGKLPRGPRVA